jgi:PDZ domain-containing protein
MTDDHDDMRVLPQPADAEHALDAGVADPTPPTPGPSSVPSVPFDGGAAVQPLPPARGHRRRRLWAWTVFIVVVVALVVASRWNLDYYALQPGTAQSVQQFITVPADKNHPVTHPVLLTDVEIGRVTALTYLFFKLQSNAALEQVESVTGGLPPSQLTAQGNLEMSQAEDDAKAAALTRLGYAVTATPSGAVIFGTFPGTPAYGVLNVGDVITAVDGMATPSTAALNATLKHYHSGQTVDFTVRRSGTAAPVSVPITLKTTEVDLGAGQIGHLDLGIYSEDQIDYTYPFPVKIDVTNIGGPSAGLAMTIGVIDALTNGSVTGGHTVAATGTIDAQGNVGDVGGVAQKTVAVENAGATIFLVPPQEYKAAMSKDRPGLHVYAVSTLDQALRILQAHGGKVPPAPSPSSPTASRGGTTG